MTARPPRIALYSHDTMGLGHMRRNLLLAEELASSPHRPSVLLISGSREVARFGVPRGVDVLSLPALYKDSTSQYHARSLELSLHEVIALRSATILGALEAFQPDVFVVDNVPRGAVGELDPALLALCRQGRTRCVLGLRDILDDATHVRAEWARAANTVAVRRYFDAIWVYGDREVNDVAQEYGLPADVAHRIRYTGYLDQRARQPLGVPAPSIADCPTILCLLGGGQDGIGLAEAFAQVRWPSPFRGLLVTGPMMSDSNKERIRLAAAGHERLDVVEFLADPAQAMQQAHAVVTMGGYNTVCDVLSFAPRALIVPRVHPRTEQLIRAERLAARGLMDVMRPDDVTPDALVQWACAALTPQRPTTPVRMHTTSGLHALFEEVLQLPTRRRQVRRIPAVVGDSSEVRHAS